ncbi:MAG: DNA repair protein RecN [Prevotella sp.]
MLTQLYIKNFTLIDELNVDFHPGFSVITGETGAGKSIILGALGLLLGNRADVKTIKEGTQRCIVEGHFDITRYALEQFFFENDIDFVGEDCILRREVNSNGKSRAFINDTPVGLNLMKELGEQLIDIHSQHQNLLLQKQDFQLSVVDIIAKNQSLLTQCKKEYAEYNDSKSKLQRAKQSIEESKTNIDFIRFQYNELAALNLQVGEEESLEQQSKTMQHSEDIKSSLYEVDSNLSDESTGIITRLYRSLSAIKSIADVLPQAEDITERLDNTYIELKDISSEVSDMLENIEYDPQELERINNRLDAIYTLQQKHHVNSVEELVRLQEDYKATLDNVENSDVALEELENSMKESLTKVSKTADELTKKRKASIKTIVSDIAERLKALALPNVSFNIDIKKKEISSNGCDDVEFLFSANPGTPLRPISEIASGGEIARVMLSLKAMLSGAVKLPTIIFDEIDTGVSGRIAEQMAVIMKEMGHSDRQVISITHLPQIAAQGSNHYKVYKEQDNNETHSHLTHLTDDERIQEIAQMLSGSNVTEAAINNAKELLGQ